MSETTRIGVLTGGGDAPGLNAVIRAVVKSASNAGIEVLGIEDSFDGLIEPGRTRVLRPKDVTGILRLGGTILGHAPIAAIRSPIPCRRATASVDYSTRVIEMFHRLGLDALVVIGGDGTLTIAHRALQAGAFRSSACRRRSTTTSSAR